MELTGLEDIDERDLMVTKYESGEGIKNNLQIFDLGSYTGKYRERAAY